MQEVKSQDDFDNFDDGSDIEFGGMDGMQNNNIMDRQR
jgi:hypothetical protein